MLVVRTVLGALLGLGLAAGSARADSDLWSDSGIQGPPYQQILDQTAGLATRNPGWASVTDYGVSAGGKTLRVIKIQNPAFASASQHLESPLPEGRPAVLISGATHGDEYLSVEDRLAPWFLDNRESSPGLMKFLAAGGILYVVPILNPDGYEARTRENAHGVDLNRDFALIPEREPNFTEPESRTLADWLDQDLLQSKARLKLTVDYHCCNGSLLFPWAYKNDDLPAETQAAHLQIARLMLEDIDHTYDYGNTGQVLGYNPRGTSKDYYYARYGALAFTYEGSYKVEGTKFPKHVVWWDHVLSLMAD